MVCSARFFLLSPQQSTHSSSKSKNLIKQDEIKQQQQQKTQMKKESVKNENKNKHRHLVRTFAPASAT